MTCSVLPHALSSSLKRTSVLFQSWTFAGPLKSDCLCQGQGTGITGCLRTELLSATLPPPHGHVALVAPASSSRFCSDLLGACQRPFVTGLEKNNKEALPSNPLRNVKTRVWTHRPFVAPGTRCQLPSEAGRVKRQNTVKCSAGLYCAHWDRGCILLKKATLWLLPN